MDDDKIQELQKQAREMLDKRNFERFRTRLQVRYRQLGETEVATLLHDGSYAPTSSEKGRSKETKDLFKVITDDVSQGGLRIVSPVPIAIGVVMAVELHLPEIPLPIAALAEVVWISENPGGGHACGLRFTQINKTDLTKLERFLLLQKPASS